MAIMEDLLEVLLFNDELSAEDRAGVREEMKDDPELARAWAHWRQVRLYIREQLEERLSDRRLLVLYVLAEEGETEALTDREQAVLAEAQNDITEAIEVLPGLKPVVEDIREARTEFEDTWESSPTMETVPSSPGTIPVEESPPNRSERASRVSKGRDRRPMRRYTRGLLALTAVAVLVVVAVLVWPDSPDRTTVTVPDGTVRTVALGDGLSARLVGPAALSHAELDGGVVPQRVRVNRGRVFFDVSPRSDRTFVVETPSATATVVGTQFGMRTTTDTTEVILASGSVQVNTVTADAGEGVVLEPGQKTWVSKETAPASPTSVDVTRALQWTGLFVFRSTPLRTIAERLRKHYDVQIEVAQEVESEPITGTFDREQPVEQVLNALAATLGADVEKTGEEAYRVGGGS